MNLKTTLVLLVLVAGASLVITGTLPKLLGLAHDAPDPAGQGTLEVMEKQLNKDAITRIVIKPRGAEQPVILERGAGGVWTAPGQWPTRKPEVEKLVTLLSGLRSRFLPEALNEENGRENYGLETPAVVVNVKAGPTDYRLAFGEPPLSGSPIDKPTYLRLDQREEVVRLAPGLVSELNLPADYYLQRRLFTDVERVAKEGMGDSPEKVEQLAAKAISVEEAKPGGTKFTMTKVNSDWELTQPMRDRLDPDRRKSVLQAVPDIWAEQFVVKPDKDLSKYGLKDSKETIKVTSTNGGTISLVIGSESPTKKTRTVARPAPQVPGMPPQQMTQKIEEHFRYAKLENNDQIFEIKSEKLKDVFVPIADLRDSRIARFESKDATKLELTRGTESIVLVKDKDHWRMEKPTPGDAETSKITDILDKVVFLSARDKDVLDKSDPKIDGLEKPQAILAITYEEEIKGDGETKTKKPARTVKLTVGRQLASACGTCSSVSRSRARWARSCGLVL